MIDLRVSNGGGGGDIGDAIPSAEKGRPNGVATLDNRGKVPTMQLPTVVKNVVEYNEVGDFPATGEATTLYVEKTTDKLYRWNGTKYVELTFTKEEWDEYFGTLITKELE